MWISVGLTPVEAAAANEDLNLKTLMESRSFFNGFLLLPMKTLLHSSSKMLHCVVSPVMAHHANDNNRFYPLWMTCYRYVVVKCCSSELIGQKSVQ